MTTQVNPFGTGNRMMSGGCGCRTSTKPPMAGAMLSGCAPPCPDPPDERRRHELVCRRVAADQRIDRDHGRCRARRASPKAARKRQALPDRQRDATLLAEHLEQRLRRDARRVPGRLPRNSSAVVQDVVNLDARRNQPRGDGVARLLHRKAEDVESARDIRHGGRGKRSDDGPAGMNIVSGRMVIKDLVTTYDLPNRQTSQSEYRFQSSRGIVNAQVVRRAEAPVGARRLSSTCRPRIDDRLALRVDGERNDASGTPSDDVRCRRPTAEA